MLASRTFQKDFAAADDLRIHPFVQGDGSPVRSFGKRLFGIARSRPLALVVAAYLVIAAVYVSGVPIWEATDEAGHFAYVKYLRDYRTLPYQPPDPQQLVLSHWFHPPLYYAIGAVATAWLDLSDFSELARPNPHFQWVQGDAPGGWNVFLPPRWTGFPPGTVVAVFLLRALSVLMGVGVLWATYEIAHRLAPDRPAIALGAVALTAFNPSFVYMTAGVHNDNLATLLGTMLLLWSVRAVTGPLIDVRMRIVGGLLLGLALLAKTSALALVPVVATAAAIGGGCLHSSAATSAPKRIGEKRIGSAIRRALASSALTVGIAAVVAGWWYARNQIVYGDPLAWQRYMTTHAFLVRPQPYDLQAFRDFAAQLARTYWAAFGYMNLVVDQWIYDTLWCATLLAAFGILRVVGQADRRRDVSSHWLGWLLAVGAAMLYFASLVRYSSILGGVGHGRLIVPAISAISLVLAVGLHQLPPRRIAHLTSGVAALGLAVLALACPFVYIRPAYAVPQPVRVDALPVSTSDSVTFGQHLRLIAWEIEREQVQPGDRARVRLFWQAAESNPPDLLVNLRLRDREGTTLFEVERRPLKGRLPTDRWHVGDVYEDIYDVEVPERAYTGRAPVEVRVRPSTGDYLPVLQSSGRAGDPASVIGHLAIAAAGGVDDETRPENTSGVSHPVRVTLGEQIELVGYDLPSTIARPGGKLQVVLYWRSHAPIVENYTVFAHVADPSGRPVAQHDAEPLDRAYPTSVWKVDEVIRDSFEIAIPPDMPKGDYRLLVGMYLHATGARLPVTETEPPSGPDYVHLATVTIAE